MRSHILSERSDFWEGKLRKWRQDSIPSLCGMFVYDDETSSVINEDSIAGEWTKLLEFE